MPIQRNTCSSMYSRTQNLNYKGDKRVDENGRKFIIFIQMAAAPNERDAYRIWRGWRGVL
jgi:hypothetical protein